jgi:hypothetical protein
MGTFETFAIYAGAVICFGGLIFAGIRMLSGRFQFTSSDLLICFCIPEKRAVEWIAPRRPTT